MAEEVADEESEYDDDIDDESDEVYGTYVLRGFRFFNNIINDEEHEQEDLEDEDELEEYIAELEEANATTVNAAVPQDEEAVKPPLSHITQKLVDQGVTMEALVKVLLMNLDEYDRDYEDFERVENEMCGRVRTILNNYTPPPV
jgi:hypothetical protein